MTICGIDPGPTRSAFVVFDGQRIFQHGILDNELLLSRLRRIHEHAECVVIERIASYGMAVGDEVFETVFWSGRFTEAVRVPVHRLTRQVIKLHLCHVPRAKDANIRQALVDRFGGKDKAIGRKAAPGPLHDIHADEWSALSVAVTWWDQHSLPSEEKA